MLCSSHTLYKFYLHQSLPVSMTREVIHGIQFKTKERRGKSAVLSERQSWAASSIFCYSNSQTSSYLCIHLRKQSHVTTQLFSFQVLWESMAHRGHLVLQDNMETKVFKENLVPEVPQVVVNLLLSLSLSCNCDLYIEDLIACTQFEQLLKQTNNWFLVWVVCNFLSCVFVSAVSSSKTFPFSFHPLLCFACLKLAPACPAMVATCSPFFTSFRSHR